MEPARNEIGRRWIDVPSCVYWRVVELKLSALSSAILVILSISSIFLLLDGRKWMKGWKGMCPYNSKKTRSVVLCSTWRSLWDLSPIALWPIHLFGLGAHDGSLVKSWSRAKEGRTHSHPKRCWGSCQVGRAFAAGSATNDDDDIPPWTRVFCCPRSPISTLTHLHFERSRAAAAANYFCGFNHFIDATHRPMRWVNPMLFIRQQVPNLDKLPNLYIICANSNGRAGEEPLKSKIGEFICSVMSWAMTS